MINEIQLSGPSKQDTDVLSAHVFCRFEVKDGKILVHQQGIQYSTITQENTTQWEKTRTVEEFGEWWALMQKAGWKAVQ